MYPRGHRAAGELAPSWPIPRDDDKVCVPGLGHIGERLGWSGALHDEVGATEFAGQLAVPV